MGHKCLRSSPNIDIQQLADMADAKTKQYDKFRTSKEVLKEIRKTAAGNLISKLNTQGAVIRYVWSEVLQSSKNAWFAVQGNLSRNLHNFFTFKWICLPIILLILVGVELPLCVVVTLS